MSNPLAILYTSENCQEGDRAIALFERYDFEYKTYSLDKDFTQKQFEQEFGKEAYLPQIAIGCKHVGGMKDLLQFLKNNHIIE